MGAKLGGPGGGDKWHVEANSEINVTPFVDVMMVLLIIFMVASAVATVSVKVDLPNANAPPSPSPPKPVFLSIKNDGSIFISDKQSSLDALGADLKAQIGARDPAKERVYIRGDKQTTFGDFTKLMGKLQDEGFYSVALVGQDVHGK
jgi:biopolymer transport protein ExbD